MHVSIFPLPLGKRGGKVPEGFIFNQLKLGTVQGAKYLIFI